jgi:hypothetical protein
MPANQNQHYVPKCHLRPFCLGSEAINLYNIRQDRLIERAPIKGQCARTYFYGRDGALERALQPLEGLYATTVAKLENDPASVTPKDLAHLRDSMLLQTFRTYGYIEKLMAASDHHYADLKAAAAGRSMPPRMLKNHQEAIDMAMHHCVKTREDVADLDTCLIVNKTRHEFITSDDPAIQTNRFHFQKLKRSGFGFASAGVMFFLPLSPRLAFIAFDGNVYVAPDRQGNTVTIKRDDEVAAINELQLLHARQNLYYADAATGQLLATEFRRHAASRPKVWHKFTYFQKVGETSKGKSFERVNEIAFGTGREFLTAFQMEHAHPSRWTGLLKYRLRPRFVDTGTGAGCIRPTMQSFEGNRAASAGNQADARW